MAKINKKFSRRTSSLKGTGVNSPVNFFRKVKTPKSQKTMNPAVNSKPNYNSNSNPNINANPNHKKLPLNINKIENFLNSIKGRNRLINKNEEEVFIKRFGSFIKTEEDLLKNVTIKAQESQEAQESAHPEIKEVEITVPLGVVLFNYKNEKNQRLIYSLPNGRGKNILTRRVILTQTNESSFKLGVGGRIMDKSVGEDLEEIVDKIKIGDLLGTDFPGDGCGCKGSALFKGLGVTRCPLSTQIFVEKTGIKAIGEKLWRKLESSKYTKRELEILERLTENLKKLWPSPPMETIIKKLEKCQRLATIKVNLKEEKGIEI